MAASTLQELREGLRREIRDEGSNAPIFSDAELNAYINRAIGAYSQDVPQEAILSIALTAGVATYDEPDRALEVLSIRTTAQEYAVAEVFAGKMTLSPVPQETGTATCRAYLLHTALTGDSDTSTIEPADEPLIVLCARAECCSALAGESARFYRYVEGDVDENRGQSQKQLRDEAEALQLQFEDGCRQARKRWMGRRGVPAARTVAGVISRKAPQPSRTIWK